MSGLFTLHFGVYKVINMVCIYHQYSVHNTIMLYAVVAMKYLFLAMVDSFTLQMEMKNNIRILQHSSYSQRHMVE